MERCLERFDVYAAARVTLLKGLDSPGTSVPGSHRTMPASSGTNSYKDERIFEGTIHLANASCSATVKILCRISLVQINEVSPDEAKIIAITTNW